MNSFLKTVRKTQAAFLSVLPTEKNSFLIALIILWKIAPCLLMALCGFSQGWGDGRARV